MKKTLTTAAVALLLCSCSIQLPVAATSNPIGPKVGTASAVTFLGITIDGDASIRSAAESAGIERVSTVDMRTTNVLFLFQKRTCTVTGN